MRRINHATFVVLVLSESSAGDANCRDMIHYCYERHTPILVFRLGSWEVVTPHFSASLEMMLVPR